MLCVCMCKLEKYGRREGSCQTRTRVKTKGGWNLEFRGGGEGLENVAGRKFTVPHSFCLSNRRRGCQPALQKLVAGVPSPSFKAPLLVSRGVRRRAASNASGSPASKSPHFARRGLVQSSRKKKMPQPQPTLQHTAAHIDQTPCMAGMVLHQVHHRGKGKGR